MRGEFEVLQDSTVSDAWDAVLDLTGSGILYWAMFKANGVATGFWKITIDGNVMFDFESADFGADELAYAIPDVDPTLANKLTKQNTFDALCMLNIEYQDGLKVEIKTVAANPVNSKTAYAVDDGSIESANTELASVPASTGSLRAMIQYLFEKSRHVVTMNKDTGVETLMKDDGGTPLGTATHSDNGTTVTKGEMT